MFDIKRYYRPVFTNGVCHDLVVGRGDQVNFIDVNNIKTLLAQDLCKVSPNMFIEKQFGSVLFASLLIRL